MPSATGATADPGGPYLAREASSLVLDGSGSRGSSGTDLTFGPAQVINPAYDDLTDWESAIAKGDNGTLMVVWIHTDEPRLSGWERLFFTRRLSNGTFTPPLELDARDREAQHILSPSVAVRGSIVYVAWGVVAMPPNGIYLRRSFDGGLTFGPPQVVYTKGGGEEASEFVGVRVVPVGDRLYVAWHRPDEAVVWCGGDVYIARSDDGGGTFLPPIRVNAEAGRAAFSHPASYDMLVDNAENLSMVWVYADDPCWWEEEVRFVSSTDGGLTFSSPVPVTDAGRLGPLQPRLARGLSGRIHVVWRDWRAGGAGLQVWYAASGDGGASFSANRQISDEPAGTSAAARGDAFLSDEMGNLHLVWADLRDGTERARILVSHDDGATFEPSVRLDPFDSEQHPDGAILTEDGIAVVWTDTAKPAAPRDPVKCSPFACVSNVVFVEGSLRRPVISYAWDLDAATDADGDGNATNDADATGPTPTVTYGDDGTYVVTLRVADDLGLSASATTTVTVLNEPPTIDDLAFDVTDVRADAWLRVAGEKWHDVRATWSEDGVPVRTVTLVREPGSPDERAAFLGTVEPADRVARDVLVAYTPEDDPPNGQVEGATPAWIVLRVQGGGERSLHHLFNVRHPETWTWSVAGLEDLLPAYRVAFTARATDAGSDDLAFLWDFGDGSAAASVHYNDGLGPDPPHSPGGVFPFTATDAVTHEFPLRGTFSVTLTVADDDGGAATRVVVLGFPLWDAASGIPLLVSWRLRHLPPPFEMCRVRAIP